ncbi:hypothetical protein [Nocardia sp. NPDC004711]
MTTVITDIFRIRGAPSGSPPAADRIGQRDPSGLFGRLLLLIAKGIVAGIISVIRAFGVPENWIEVTASNNCHQRQLS